MSANSLLDYALDELPYDSEVLVERKGSWIIVRSEISAQDRSETINSLFQKIESLGAEKVPPCSNSAAGSVRLGDARLFLKPMPRKVAGCANDSGNETMFAKNLKHSIKRPNSIPPTVIFRAPRQESYVIPDVSSVRRISRSKSQGVADFTIRSSRLRRTFPVSLKKTTAAHYSVSADLYEPVKIVMDGLLRDGEITIEEDSDGEPYIVESAVAFPVSRDVAQECVFGGMSKGGFVIWGNFINPNAFCNAVTDHVIVECDSICRDIDEFFDQGHEIFAMVRRAKGRTYGSEQFYNGLRLVTCSRDRLVGNYTIFEDIII